MDSEGVLLQAMLNGILSIGIGFGQMMKPKHAICLLLYKNYAVIGQVFRL